MEIPRSVRLARLSALIVLFILSSVTVGYVAVRMMGDRDLAPDTAAQVTARASTHSSAGAALETHASSPFMAYSASPASVRLDGDADDDFAIAGAAAASGLTALPADVADYYSGDRDFTGSSHSAKSRSSSGGFAGFSAGGNVGSASGAYGGVSGSSTQRSTTTTTTVTTHATSHTTSSSPSHSSSGGSSSASTSASSTSPAATTAAVTPPATTVAPAVAAVTTTAATATTTVSGRTGGVVALSVPGPLGGGSPAPTPEPISLLLIGSGLGGALGFRRLFH